MLRLIMQMYLFRHRGGVKQFSYINCTTYSQTCNLFFSTPDTRPAGLEEADQQPLPGEQGINLDSSGPKLPEFSNRPPGDKMLAKVCMLVIIYLQHYKAFFQGNNSVLFYLLTRLL